MSNLMLSDEEIVNAISDYVKKHYSIRTISVLLFNRDEIFKDHSVKRTYATITGTVIPKEGVKDEV